MFNQLFVKEPLFLLFLAGLTFLGNRWCGAQTLTVPKDKLKFVGDVPVKWEARRFEVVPHNGEAPGAKSTHSFQEITNGTGKAHTYEDMSDQSAITYYLNFSEPVDITGLAGIGGKASGGITKPRGWIKCTIQANAKVKYADQVVEAGKGRKGIAGFAVTTDGLSKTIGGGVEIHGYGASFTTSWVEQEEGHNESAVLGDVDAGLTRTGTQAVVTLQAYVKGTMYLEDKAKGEWEASAFAGALVEAHPHTLPHD